ncbi:MAG: hypothetical protein ACM3XM_06720, partial [Mycobacterium leprae]
MQRWLISAGVALIGFGLILLSLILMRRKRPDLMPRLRRAFVGLTVGAVVWGVSLYYMFAIASNAVHLAARLGLSLG